VLGKITETQAPLAPKRYILEEKQKYNFLYFNFL